MLPPEDQDLDLQNLTKIDSISVEKKSRVCFMTTQDRGIFPLDVPPTRFGNDLNPIRGSPYRGPGNYENEAVRNTVVQR